MSLFTLQTVQKFRGVVGNALKPLHEHVFFFFKIKVLLYLNKKIVMND